MIPTLRTAEAFNYSLVIGMTLGFVMEFVLNGKDIRKGLFEKIYNAQQ